ncbi:DUF3368 domain-containing protein [Candidatus Electronema sp. PJ]|uniref:DUF3368 domain-containing protein n=1 Tax=Candidatus Electronema sp. PJ TaxID=3401572 RepID=UPI003AA85EB3
MTAFRVIADSSSIIGLTHIGLFGRLPDIFRSIFIPDSVYQDVTVKGKGRPGAEETEKALQAGWLVRRTVQDTLAVDALLTCISRGEAEVLVLAKEIPCDYALVDEKIARNVAALLDVKTVGVLGVMKMAALAGIPVKKQEAVDILRSAGFRISEKLCQHLLKP